MPILDSLQDIALDRALKTICGKDTIEVNSYVVERERFEILEDKDLVNFNRELCRSYILCLIKDRANQLDMPAMFLLMKMYLMVYFTEVTNMKESITHSFNSDKSNVIYSDDVLNEKLFAWYDIFCLLCDLDMFYNQKLINDKINSLTRLLEVPKMMDDLNADIDAIKNEISEIDFPGAISSENPITSLMVELMKYNNVINDNHYNEIMDKMDMVRELMETVKIKYVESDGSFERLKSKVVDSLLVKMKEHEMCIYNNEFENICKKLIIVSHIRMYDIDNDIENYNEYSKKKDEFFNQIKEISTFTKKYNNELEKFLYEQNQSIDLWTEIGLLFRKNGTL